MPKRNRIEGCPSKTGEQVAILDKDGTIVMVNKLWQDAAETDCPVSQGISIGDNILQKQQHVPYVLPTSGQKILDGIKGILNGEQEEFCEEYSCQCENVIHWFRFNITPLVSDTSGAVLTRSDITEYKQKGTALKENEERFRKLVELLPNLLIVHHNGSIEFINPAGVKLLGGTHAEDFIGKNVLDLVHPDFRGQVLQRVQSISQGGEGVPLMEEKLVRSSGEVIDAEIAATKLEEKGENKVMVVAHDVTEKNAAMQKIIENESLLRAIFDTVPDCIRIMDLDGGVLMINKAGLRIMGVDDHDQLTSVAVDSMLIPPFKEKYKQLMENVKKGGSGQLVYDIVNFKQQVLHLETQMVPLRDGKDEISGILIVTRDITEQRDAESQAIRATADLQYIENHDPVTALPNKKLFKELLRRKIEEGKKENRQTCLMLLDLDHFKDLIEVHGEELAHEYLLAFKERLQTSVKHYDTVGHFGGDKFGIIISEALTNDDFQKIISRIFHKLSEPLSDFMQDPVEGHISMGISFAHVPEALSDDAQSDKSEIDTMIQQAMQAIAIAKQNGGDSYEFFSTTMSDQFRERKEMESDLHKAIEKGDEFCLHYQPIYELETGRIIGMEALARWNHPTKGLLAPAKFIDLAEETGLMVSLGDWIFKEACRQQAEWMDKGYRYRLSINLSLKQLYAEHFIDMVQQTLAETKADPHMLELEITESTIAEDFMIQKIRALKDLGFFISIDDFGTGQSSLTRLIKIPVNCIKIDKKFIEKLIHNPMVSSIIRAILYFANDNKIRIIAEGVETEEQRTYLKGLGCHEMQGYLMSMPLSAKEFATYVEKQEK